MGYGIELPVRHMLEVLVCLIAFNIGSQLRWHERRVVTNNPFAFLYLLQVILSAVLLEAGSTWIIVAVTSLCLAGLAKFSDPLVLSHDRVDSYFSLYVQGTLLCFATNAALLVFFITRMDLLVSIAAHELGTPLSMLSVILGNWRHMPEFANNPELREEIGEMQTQMLRCKPIVSGILLSAGEARGELSVKTTINIFLNELVD